jgi:hypothetical protein
LITKTYSSYEQKTSARKSTEFFSTLHKIFILRFIGSVEKGKEYRRRQALKSEGKSKGILFCDFVRITAVLLSMPFSTSTD